MQEVRSVDYDISPDQDDGMQEYLSMCELGNILNRDAEHDVLEGYGPADTYPYESML